MDYVVYGTGYGATLMLLGYAVRTWGPDWRFRDEDAYDRGQVGSARSAWTRFAHGLGAVIATCGAVLILMTFLMMLINPGDSIGVMISLVVSGLVLIAVGVWAWMYWDRFGSFGVLPLAQTVAGPAPLRYDDRKQGSGSASDEEARQADEEDLIEDEVEEIGLVDEGEEDEGIGEREEAGETVLDADTDDFNARYTKFELHHPDADADDLEERYARATEAAGTAVSADPGELDARASKFEQHHPEPEGYDDVLDDESPATAAVEMEVLGESEPVVDDAASDAVTEVVEAPVEDESSGEDQAAAEPAADADETSKPIEPDTGTRQERGGREEALRRLRERRAQRSQRPDDDA